MAADLNLLDPELRGKVVKLVERCMAKGVEMRPSSGLRDPWEQARLWRQSRSVEEISAAIARLKSEGAPFLAGCIEQVGPQHGDHVTDTPPGISWHQWGEALDAFWVVDGKAEWSTTRKINGLNGYHLWADEAEKLGLTAGGHWNKFKDWPHVQLRKANNAANVFSLPEIDAAMRERFGGGVAILPKIGVESVKQKKCGRYDTYRSGAYYVTNNVWNGDLADTGKQCISEPSGNRYGWNWTWPVNGTDSPISYPAVVYGDKPWDQDGPTTTVLPRRIADLQQVYVSHDYLLAGHGRRNVSYNFWLIQGSKSVKSAIRHEVMIWMQWEGGVRPTGSLVSHGAGYEFWSGARSAEGLHWQCHTIRLIGNQAQANVDVLEWLNWLCQSQGIPTTLSLADVEFGTEIWDGEGSMDLKYFAVTAI